MKDVESKQTPTKELKPMSDNKLFTFANAIQAAGGNAGEAMNQAYTQTKGLCEKYQVSLNETGMQWNGGDIEIWVSDAVLIALMQAGHEGATNVWLKKAFG